MKTVSFRLIAAVGASSVLSACSILMPPTQVSADIAPAWQAPLPHQGAVGALSQWWQQQGDPLLVELIEAAQGVNPSVAQALARIEAARASRVAAGAALLPQVSASVGASRGVSQPAVPVATSLQGGLQAAWELDLVGANRAVNKAALAQLEGTQAQWHDARVSVAAEVAQVYYSLSTCKQLLDLARKDAASRQETARLSEVSAKAGFTAPGVAAMARASAAEGSSRVTQQAALCELDTKALVALTALPEQDLKQKVALAPAVPAQTAPILIASVPAQTLAQRPDVFAAERDVVVASAQVGSAKAQRYPRLTLNGSVGALRYSSMGTETNLDTWSFGPLALSLPLFDGGQRKANVVAAEASYTQAVAIYRAKVRQAVREVEEALVNLQSTDARRLDSEVSTLGYAESLAATQARYGQGLASLVELEDARRLALASQSAQLALALERKRAWVALYRALGGGFEPATVQSAAASNS
ncbi:MAG: RND transporter [Burkholderiales bacterium RIFCSPLOWO2_12_FULL_61_40]|nr:MAG: RND transporter [Burkholderiales bacterium RIFCSPLOWO2_12_FULL_61_40]